MTNRNTNKIDICLNDQVFNQAQLYNQINGHKGSKQKIFMYFCTENIEVKDYAKKSEPIEGVPAELHQLLDGDEQANAFFETLSKSYKQGYCDWVGSAKQEQTRKTRAEKAMQMLRNNQKTLKTV